MIIEQNQYQPGPVTYPLPSKDQWMYLSEYYDHYSNYTSDHFCMRIPLQGNMHFKTNSGEFDLNTGFYLQSFQPAGVCFIESKSPVRFFSVDIGKDIIYAAFDKLKKASCLNLEGLSAEIFFSGYFFEHIYPVDGSELGRYLLKLARSLNEKAGSIVDDNVFELLAEKIVASELNNYTSIQKLNSIKTATKKETLKRLLKGKNYIDINYLKNPGIAEIAKFCSLSGFHFLRSFKQAFSLSPYQYMLQKRLDHASNLLLESNESVSTIAGQCSFSDSFTFSKAFKKCHGVSPTDFRKKLCMAG